MSNIYQKEFRLLFTIFFRGFGRPEEDYREGRSLFVPLEAQEKLQASRNRAEKAKLAQLEKRHREQEAKLRKELEASIPEVSMTREEIRGIDNEIHYIENAIFQVYQNSPGLNLTDERREWIRKEIKAVQDHVYTIVETIHANDENLESEDDFDDDEAEEELRESAENVKKLGTGNLGELFWLKNQLEADALLSDGEVRRILESKIKGIALRLEGQGELMGGIEEIAKGFNDTEKIKDIHGQLVEAHKEEKAFTGIQKIVLGSETEISGIESEIRNNAKKFKEENKKLPKNGGSPKRPISSRDKPKDVPRFKRFTKSDL